MTCEKTSRESKYRRINWHCVWLANQKTLFTPTLIHPPDWELRKVLLKSLWNHWMHAKTHEKTHDFFLNRETIPYFIFFLKSRDRYLRELGLRKFVIVEVVYMIHTELSRLGLWLIKYDSLKKWVICRTSPRSIWLCCFVLFGMNFYFVRNELRLMIRIIFRTWTRAFRTW